MIPSVQDFQNLSVVSDRGPHALAGSQRAAVQVFELLLFEGVCLLQLFTSVFVEKAGFFLGSVRQNSPCDRHAHLLWR